MNKKVLIAIGALLLVLAILFIGKKQGWVGTPDGTKVITEKVAERTITETVTASGKIQPETEVAISPDVAGKIIALPVKEGDKVEKGQLLVKINPDIYVATVERLEATLNTSKANVANSQARLEQVKAQFENAKQSFERNKKLFEQKTISQADYDAAVSAFKTAEAEVKAAEESINAADFNVKSAAAALQEAKDNMSRTTIYSPVNGTISKLNFEVGETVVGTQQMMGSEIMTIANLNEMEVQVEVNENDIIRVGLGDSVDIEVDAYYERKFKGVVTSIANSAKVSGMSLDEVTNFEVKIRVLKESYADLENEKQPGMSPFRPGMSASVEIKTKTVEDVLSVPLQAVTTRDLNKDKEEDGEEHKGGDEDEQGFEEAKGGKKEKKEQIEECVFVNVGGKAVRKVVKTGIQNSEHIEVLEGLELGDEIVTGPYTAVSKQLEDGDPIEVVDEEELYKGFGKK